MRCELGDTKRVSDISKQPGVPVAMGLYQIRYLSHPSLRGLAVFLTAA
ncbi:MAG: hypothetical protein OSB69_14565 [Alphaproteobacteria bacterium]|nr:hypothetical protein [Alphaproteobacteria bacterium]